MAKKKIRERQTPDDDLELNMTPMIDVVFNLIIFFMVITDMTQKDLEYLILPKASMAQEDKGEDKGRLIVNIVNPNAKDLKGTVKKEWPPIFFRGRQVESLDHLRKLIYPYADPHQFPEKKKTDGTPMPPIGGKGSLYPSSKPLLVRCDQGQIFGWVQAIMQFCTFVPGRDPRKELQESPFIYKIEIAVAEKEIRTM